MHFLGTEFLKCLFVAVINFCLSEDTFYCVSVCSVELNKRQHKRKSFLKAQLILKII